MPLRFRTFLSVRAGAYSYFRPGTAISCIVIQRLYIYSTIFFTLVYPTEKLWGPVVLLLMVSEKIHNRCWQLFVLVSIVDQHDDRSPDLAS